MKIENIHEHQLTHALHLQFVDEVKSLLEKFNHGALNVTPQYETLRACIEREGQCYKITRKSELSKEKEDADLARDAVLVGFGSALRTAILHFNPETSAAAQRLKTLFDSYNTPTSVVRQSYDAETASINRLLAELNGRYAADVETAGFAAWTQELAARNAEFDRLAKAYTNRQAEKPDLRMVDARRQTDEACGHIIALLSADAIRGGEEPYKAFFAEWNELVKRYNNLTAQKQGRNKAKKDAASPPPSA